LIVDGAEHPVMDRQVLLAYLLRRDHGFPSGTTHADRPMMRDVTLMTLIMRNLTDLFRFLASRRRSLRAGARPQDRMNREEFSAKVAGAGRGRRGDIDAARTLIETCLERLLGSQQFAEFAEEVGAALPPRAREMRAERAAV
jgi:hypothetical protein